MIASNRPTHNAVVRNYGFRKERCPLSIARWLLSQLGPINRSVEDINEEVKGGRRYVQDKTVPGQLLSLAILWCVPFSASRLEAN
eukprot:5897956-Pyramimonas_sp.AAC.1